MRAPDFSLPDQTKTIHHLADYLGKWVVLYFYPKDDTPGCTTEACSFRDNVIHYQEAGVVVFGISRDTVGSHGRFAEKYSLGFPLLSDPSGSVAQAYGAWGKKKFMGREFEGLLRQTFIISPDGSIAQRYEEVEVDGHAELVLAEVARLKQGIP